MQPGLLHLLLGYNKCCLSLAYVALCQAHTMARGEVPASSNVLVQQRALHTFALPVLGSCAGDERGCGLCEGRGGESWGTLC